jgi:hypothetical protein
MTSSLLNSKNIALIQNMIKETKNKGYRVEIKNRNRVTKDSKEINIENRYGSIVFEVSRISDNDRIGQVILKTKSLNKKNTNGGFYYETVKEAPVSRVVKKIKQIIEEQQMVEELNRVLKQK